MAKIVIAKKIGDTEIGVATDFSNMSVTEVAMFIAEIEVIKKKLVKKFEGLL